NADAYESSGQYARDREGRGAWRGQRWDQLATALSRHGIDWRVVDAAAAWRAAGGDVAAGVFDAAGALAASDEQAQGNDYGGAEFCLRALRAQGVRQSDGRLGFELHARGDERRGAGEPGDAGAICGAL